MENIISISMVIAGMIWIGLLLAALLGKALVSLLPSAGKKEQWKDKGVEAEALVLGMEETGDPVNNYLRLKIQLQVRPDKGRSFVVEIKEAFPGDAAAALKTGNIVRVKYNPANTRELFLIQAAS